MLHIALTADDHADLKLGHSFNTGADDGREVDLDGDDFTPEMMAQLEAGQTIEAMDRQGHPITVSSPEVSAP